MRILASLLLITIFFHFTTSSILPKRGNFRLQRCFSLSMMKTDVDQHITATISEIDRVLRSLGTQDDYGCFFSQPSSINSHPSLLTAAVVRANGAVQTNRPTCVSTGTQISPFMVSQGVQNSPQQHAAFCQTEKGADSQECLDQVKSSVLRTNAVLEERLQALESSLCKMEAVFLKLNRLENKLNSAVKSCCFLRNRWIIQIIENEEASNRNALQSRESSARTESMFLWCGELMRLVTVSRKECALSKPFGGRKKHNPTRVIENGSVVEETPSSSLNDLTELLGECWRILDE
ncbi:hypothetical protein, conserved [Leishmania tarentolae]|uniref:Uncharacterized protein n=1 Tax=Leishmania tarentolae TaxID=5689 RepID=A0A640KJS9_LEITA|nr:hypothetical protein, conserved [Leishmania tarentolae]